MSGPRHRCPHCGFAVYNRRLSRCESCGGALPPSIRLSEAERQHMEADAERNEQVRRDLAADAERAEAERERRRGSGG